MLLAVAGRRRAGTARTPDGLLVSADVAEGEAEGEAEELPEDLPARGC